MKKRTAFIGAILSLIPLGQPLLIKTGAVLSTTGFLLSFSEKVNAESADFYFDRAYDKAERGDHYGALSDYTKAIEINPNDAKAYFNRGWSKGKLKDNYGAISDYTKAIEINPNYAQAYNNRGVAKSNIGDDQGGCDDFKKAISLGNKETEKWFKTDGAAWCRDM